MPILKRLLTVFLAHAPTDAPLVEQLRTFLETAIDAICFAPDAEIKPGHDMISVADLGLSADVLILLLSPASNPSRWPRERWESVLFQRAAETGTRIAVFLLEECAFPQLLRRGLRFFDATTDLVPAMRELKRWIRGIQSGTHPGMAFSPDMENLYRVLADAPGICTAAGAMAERFARQAAPDFEAVFWISAHGRTLTRIAGELGSQLGMTLDGPVEDNCRRIREVLSLKRCLVVVDAPQVSLELLVPCGRTSILLTSEPVRVVEDKRNPGTARALVSVRRFAEAYEILHELFDAKVEPEACARELAWICEHWERRDEANAFRFHLGPGPGEQLPLF